MKVERVFQLLSYCLILKPTLSPQCEVPRLRLRGPHFCFAWALAIGTSEAKLGEGKKMLFSVGSHLFAVSVSIMQAILFTLAEVIPSVCNVWNQFVVFLSLAKLVSVQPQRHQHQPPRTSSTEAWIPASLIPASKLLHCNPANPFSFAPLPLEVITVSQSS